MDVRIRKKYYRRSRPKQEPIRYNARQPKGVGTTVHAEIWMDPVLKKHNDLRRALLRHEENEIRAWGKGSSGSHSEARQREPKLLREIGGVTGFWKEINRRSKKK